MPISPGRIDDILQKKSTNMDWKKGMNILVDKENLHADTLVEYLMRSAAFMSDRSGRRTKGRSPQKRALPGWITPMWAPPRKFDVANP